MRVRCQAASMTAAPDSATTSRREGFRRRNMTNSDHKQRSTPGMQRCLSNRLEKSIQVYPALGQGKSDCSFVDWLRPRKRRLGATVRCPALRYSGYRVLYPPSIGGYGPLYAAAAALTARARCRSTCRVRSSVSIIAPTGRLFVGGGERVLEACRDKTGAGSRFFLPMTE